MICEYLPAKADRRQIQSCLARLPKPAASPAFFSGGEPIILNSRSEKARGSIRKRISGQKLENILFSFQQTNAEIPEPRILLRGSQSREPHLPVQPGLIRSDKTGRPRKIAGFVSKFIGFPLSPIAGPLNHDFGPPRCHDSKKAISAHQVKRCGRRLQSSQRFRQSETNPCRTEKRRQGESKHKKCQNPG